MRPLLLLLLLPPALACAATPAEHYSAFCASCHLPTYGGQEQIPRLAGQRIDYMIDAMKAYRDNTRSGADTQMSAVLFGLSDAQIEALAHFVSSK